MVRDAGVRLSKLDLRNPAIERLPDNWRNGRTPNTPAPRTNRKPTPLTQAASHGDPEGERISAHLVPPWRRTKADYRGRYTVSGKAKTARKEDAAKEHIKRLSTLQHPHTLIAYADGSRLEVNGKARTGAGCVLFHNGIQVKTLKAGLGRQAEVYDAELMALTLALHAAVTYADAHPQVTHIVLFSDNLAATNTVTDPAPRAGQLLAHNFHTRACNFLDKAENRTLEVAWCPGHHDIEGNETADTLAKEATALRNTIGPTRTHAHAKRASKAETLKAWTEEWKATPRTGRFAIADRIAPSLNPTPHFKALARERELFGRIVQCRSGHGYLGAYYAVFTPDENVDCPCGEPLQTREHIIQLCPRYDHHRHILSEKLRHAALSEVLGTAVGIQALAKFLRSSGALTKNGEPRRPRPAPRYSDEQEDDESSDEGMEEEEEEE